MATPYSWIDDFPAQITAEEYEALPEEFCQTIEVIDGHIVKCESPSRLHNRVARKMAVRFEEKSLQRVTASLTASQPLTA